MEPGRDGVGDYTRRVAAALVNLGFKVSVLALFDRYVEIQVSESQQAEDTLLSVMRIPLNESAAGRFLTAKNWLAAIDPEWVSLQYVPFAFDKRGLHFGLSRQMKGLTAGRHVHIMFHELWVGIAAEESLKLRLWGNLQRLLIKRLILTMRPAVLHTQTRLYQALLAKMGFKANYLPLFGNIPVTEVVLESDNDLKKQFDFVVFGAIHNGARISEFAHDAAAYAKKNQLNIRLIFVGRCGPEQDGWVSIWQSEGLGVEIYGDQPVESISRIMQNADFGISATAAAVVEKSGSFTALREHGLPVISISKAWTPVGFPAMELPVGLSIYQSGDFENFIALKKSKIMNNNVVEIAARLSEAFKQIAR